jgi:hypothetical protein
MKQGSSIKVIMGESNNGNKPNKLYLLTKMYNYFILNERFQCLFHLKCIPNIQY